MDKLNQDKKEIRSYIKKKKSELLSEQIQEKSDCIVKRMMEMPEFINAQHIFTYVNFNQEVVTTQLIEKCLDMKKHVYVPKVFSDEDEKFMEFIEIHKLSDLRPGYFGVLEPDGKVTEATTVQEGILIMPGLAFDRSFHRIGYGGGFYDRYLSGKSRFLTVAVAFDFQVLDEIPHEAFDLSPQVIITEKEVLKPNR